MQIQHPSNFLNVFLCTQTIQRNKGHYHLCQTHNPFFQIMNTTQEKINEELKVGIKTLIIQCSLNFAVRRGMDNITHFNKKYCIL